MPHDDSVFKATNTRILNQIGEPPPASVLTALVEVLGGEPEAVAAVVDQKDSSTTWQVYACRGDFLTRVVATRNIKNWAGGFHDDRGRGEPGSLAAATFRISSARSIGVEELVVYDTHEGFSRESTGKWIVMFEDGKLELDESRGRGGHMTQVANFVRERFLNS